MTNKPGRNIQRTKKLRDKLILRRPWPGDRLCVSLHQWNAIVTRYLKKKSIPMIDTQIQFISSSGRRQASLCHGPLSVVSPSVRP